MDGKPTSEASGDAKHFPDTFDNAKPPPIVGLSLSPEEMAEIAELMAASDNQVSYVENGSVPIDLRRRERLKPIIPKVDSFPRGYPRLACLVQSDPNFAMYRQYRYLRHRCLLNIQDELAELEQRLAILDADDEKNDPQKLTSRERDYSGKWLRRKELLAEIKSKLREYDELMFKTMELLTIKKPTERNRASYDAYVERNGLLVAQEEEFIKHKEDLVALGGDLEDSWLNRVVEDLIKLFSRRVWQFFFQTQSQKQLTDDEHIRYVDKSRIDTVIRVVMTVIVTILLMVPIFVLSYVQAAGWKRDLVIFAFTLIFALSLAAFTKARLHELFGATAAYCAVLVVFVNAPSLTFSTVGNNWSNGGLQNVTMSN
ncbi:hypothetical protein MMC30_003049 [Trapelia coarctata]|nr:hypothetical protein [Trapelia coarctata]